MKVISKVLHAAAVIAGLTSLLLIFGTAGAMDQEYIDINEGITKMCIFLAVFAGSVLLGNLCKGEEHEDKEKFGR